MNKKHKKYFSIFFISIFVIGLLSFGNAQEKPKTKINNELSLVLPTPNLEMEDLFAEIKELNPKVIFLRAMKHKNKPVLFAVSRYENSEPIKLDTVFYKETVNIKPNNLGDISKNYKLISYKRYKKSGAFLYTKVSSPMQGQCCVMYYFMKNNYSNVMYEIKLSGGMSEMGAMKTIAEEIALSVEL